MAFLFTSLNRTFTQKFSSTKTTRITIIAFARNATWCTIFIWASSTVANTGWVCACSSCWNRTRWSSKASTRTITSLTSLTVITLSTIFARITFSTHLIVSRFKSFPIKKFISGLSSKLEFITRIYIIYRKTISRKFNFFFLQKIHFAQKFSFLVILSPGQITKKRSFFHIFENNYLTGNKNLNFWAMWNFAKKIKNLR